MQLKEVKIEFFVQKHPGRLCATNYHFTQIFGFTFHAYGTMKYLIHKHVVLRHHHSMKDYLSRLLARVGLEPRSRILSHGSVGHRKILLDELAYKNIFRIRVML